KIPGDELLLFLGGEELPGWEKACPLMNLGGEGREVGEEESNDKADQHGENCLHLHDPLKQHMSIGCSHNRERERGRARHEFSVGRAGAWPWNFFRSAPAAFAGGTGT